MISLMMRLTGQQKIPIKLVEAIFTYVEESMHGEESYQAPQSPMGMEFDEVTHVDETKFPNAPASISGGASQAASMSVKMDLASKRMVDDLVGSETTDDRNDPESIAQSTEEITRPFGDARRISASGKDGGNETSYGLIGSSTVREHFSTNSPRPILPSITNSPFALQPGEEAPGSRPSTGEHKTPSHSQRSSQTRFPLQRPPVTLSMDSSPNCPSTMPDPTAPPVSSANGLYHNQAPLKNTFTPVQNYTKGPRTSTLFGGNPLHVVDEPNFLSLEVFEGSTWGLSSGQSGRKAANIITPPNGQGAG